MERFFSSKSKLLDSLLDIDTVYPAMSVNMIAASFHSRLDDISKVTKYFIVF